MPVEPAILVAGLHKAYGDNLVLRGVDLSVPPGTIHALLGPNGSGKTTIVTILATLIRPDAGVVRVAGHDVLADPEAVRRAIGVTGQFSAVDAKLTGRENLQLMADLHHLPRGLARGRIEELLARFELTEAAGRIPATYSGGMRRRLDLAMTLVGRPQVIFLDEPSTGLDPRGRRDLWRIVRDLARDGVTIFLTTQYLEEADQLADRIAVLDDGRIIAQGSAAELKRLVPGGHLELQFAAADTLHAARRALAHAARGHADGAVGAPADGAAGAPADDGSGELALRIPWDGGLNVVADTVNTLQHHGIPVAELTLRTPDLDDVFLALTGRRTSAESERREGVAS
jgi:ABC-2 type transport system ATP-binding protein